MHKIVYSTMRAAGPAQDAADAHITHFVLGSADAGADAPPVGPLQHRVGEDWLLGCLAQGARLPEGDHAPAAPPSPDASAGALPTLAARWGTGCIAACGAAAVPCA